jgi:hypothetical protein
MFAKPQQPLIPYHAEKETRLLRIGKSDYFTIGDAAQGVQIYGGTRSGKTSGSGRALALSYLNAGFGGIVCCSKVEEAQLWRDLARETGREEHLFFIDETAALRFNFMDYAMATIAANGFERNLATILLTISALAGEGSKGNTNEFFRDAAIEMMLAAFVPVSEFEGTLRMQDVNDFIASAPLNEKQMNDPNWQKQSYCNRVMINLHAAASAGDPRCKQICDDYGDYWFQEMPNLARDTRTSISATVGNTLKPFLTGAFRDLFCTRTDIVPEHTRQGAIIVLDIPTRKFGKQAQVAQQLFKLFWQYAMENTGKDADVRPCFCFCDEAQFVMNAMDADHLSVAAAMKACTVFITQDVPSYYANIGGDDPKNTTDSLLAKFQTRIFHANTDIETNQQAAEFCGKITKYQEATGQGGGLSTGGSANMAEQSNSTGGNAGANVFENRTITTYQDYVFPPDYFSRELRTGGMENKLLVDGIVVRNGANFATTKKHYLKATFSQK